MAKVKFRTKVLSLGEFAQEFFDEGIIVFFGKESPEELHEHSIVHEESIQLNGLLEPGDTILVGERSYKVLAVGDVVNDNLRAMGHLVMKFNGLSEPELEGDVCVPAEDLPEIKPGTIVEIREKE